MSTTSEQRRPTDGHPPRSSSATRLPTAPGSQPSSIPSARKPTEGAGPKIQSRIPNGQAVPAGVRNLTLKYARQQTVIPRSTPSNATSTIPGPSQIAVVPITDGTRGAPPATCFVHGGSESSRSGQPKVLRRKPSVIGAYMSNQNAKRSVDAKPDGDGAVDTLIIPETSEPDRKTPVLQTAPITYTIRTGIESTSTVDQPYPLPHTPVSDPSSQVPSLQYMDSPSAISSIATPTTRSSTSPLVATSPPSFGWSRGPSPTMGRNRPELNASLHSHGQVRTKNEPYSHPFFQQPLSKKASGAESPSGRSTPSVTSSVTSSVTRSKSRSKLSKPKPVDKGESSALPTLPQAAPRKTVHPPELAHLQDAKPDGGEQDVPPPRPSRDGMPSLSGEQQSSPVVYSNLTTSPQRRPSTSNSQGSPPKPQLRSFHSDPASRGTPKTETSKIKVPAPAAADEISAVPRPTKSPSRFGFFKRNKAATTSDDESKQPRKGPIAGTGHEGYKKHSAKKRSISMNSGEGSAASIKSSSSRQTTSGRRSSNGSSGTDSEVDDFLSQRLQPIYMRGDGAASDSQVYSASRHNASPSQNSQPRMTVDTTNRPRTSASSSEPPGLSHSRGSSGSDAFSGQNTGYAPRKAQSKVTGSPLAQSQSAEWDSDNSSPMIANDDRKQAPKKTGWLGFSKAFSRGKSAKETNNATRNQTLSSPTSDAEDSSTEYGSVLPARGVAHYALLDSAEQSPSLEEIEHYMHEVQFAEDSTVRLAEPISLTNSSVLSSNPTFGSDDAGRLDALAPSAATSETTLQTLLPSPFERTESENSPNDYSVVAAESVGVVQNPARPYRLPQVGRIPRVVSTRDPLRRHDQSFSRPFGTIQPRPQANPAKDENSNVGSNDQLKGLANTSCSNLGPLGRESADFTDFEDPEDEIQFAIKQSEPKFLQLEHRKNSDASYSSSSGASYFLSSTPAARIPRPSSPLSEDEVWDEYDDLLDGIFSSDSWRHASGKRLELINGLHQDAKSEARNTEGAATRRPTLRSIIKGGLKSPRMPPNSDEPVPSGSSAVPQRQSQSSSKGRRVTFDDNDLVSVRNSESSLDPESKTSKHSTSSTSDLTGEYHVRQPAKRIVDVQENADLRFGSLMTSKFLSFGRAFFSPLGEEIQAGQGHHRVLIIDGLGKDWSYYIALTYANTMVYNLGPGSTSGNKRATLSNWQHVDNHRHFNFNDFNTHFPFPKGFFSVVVLRFPPIHSDETLKHITSECRRVLAPGGFLEVAGLDLDLNNMGTITRKAVRDLKIKLKQDNPDLSLNPLSDSMLLLLGSPGFTNLNRCMVGVPAAGVVASRESSPGSIDKNNVTRFITDLSESGDKKLANMVSTCGRWWHQLMYEIHLLPEKNVLESFWNDVAVLRECERNATMFKMLICYAQKPVHTKRRTVSL